MSQLFTLDLLNRLVLPKLRQKHQFMLRLFVFNIFVNFVIIDIKTILNLTGISVFVIIVSVENSSYITLNGLKDI